MSDQHNAIEKSPTPQSQGQKEKSARNKLISRRVRFIAQEISIFYVLPFLAALIIGINVSYFVSTYFIPQSAAWFIVAFTVLAIAFISLRVVTKQATQTVSRLSHLYANNIEDIIQHLKTSIINVRGKENVQEEATTLLQDVLDQRDRSDRYVDYVGAGQLTPSREKEEELTDKNKHDHPALKFRDIMLSLLSTRPPVKITRYIQLPNTELFSIRGPEMRQTYLSWLEKQIDLLKANPNYILEHRQRAPAWGSPFSIIFTSTAMLQIIGDGEGATITRGSLVVEPTHEELLEFLDSPKQKADNRKTFTSQHVIELEQHLEELRQLHKKLLNNESGRSKRGKA